MRKELLKYMRYGELVDMMYISNTGQISKRRIKILKVAGDSVQAYCFLRHSKRTFILNNILAIVPVVKNEKNVL